MRTRLSACQCACPLFISRVAPPQPEYAVHDACAFGLRCKRHKACRHFAFDRHVQSSQGSGRDAHFFAGACVEKRGPDVRTV